ncbi:enoyl-CoA hydratase/isomerase family protein [bacterium]|nr:MAG: enoyl-CoA hydratase/isomerase family protein [bacterium]
MTVSQDHDVLRHHALSVQIEVERHRATIVLDDPERHNTVPFPARRVLRQLFEEFGEDERIRVVVLRGAGERAFSAGGNIAQFLENTPETLSELAWNVGAPERCPKPVIAELKGFAFGVGLEFALACDFRVAGESTLLALPEIKLGMIPGSGGSQRVARIAGLGRAKDMVMRGRRIPAQEALAWGLLTTVVPDSELRRSVDELSDEMCALPPLALQTAKRVLGAAYEAPLHAAIGLEGEAYGRLRSTPDFIEGVHAFAEKRPPRFPSLAGDGEVVRHKR